jgi:TRAP-type transport system small permease protein
MTAGAEPAAPVDADVEAPPGQPAASSLARAMLALGSAGLLAAMATDAIAVAGRHAGVRLFGAIEIVQACIVLIATASVVLTTLVDGHARVHILLERLSPRRSALLLRGADALSALVLAWAAAGSAWLAADLFGAAELTEVLGLPLRWLRLAWIAGLVLAAALFARRAWRGGAG